MSIPCIRSVGQLEMEPSLVLLIVATFLFVLCSIILFSREKGKENALNSHHIIAAPTSGYDLQCEVVVVGSGILGSAIAAVLSKDGRKVVTVERDNSEPDRIVGELLQPGGYAALTKLGLGDAVEDIDAHVVHGYVIHDCHSKIKSSISLSYPLDNNTLPRTGRSFHHGRFVMGLRSQARKHGVQLLEGTVTSLLMDSNANIVGVSYKDKQNDCMKVIKADLTIVADGCFSRFRKDLSSSSVTISSHFAGVIMHNCPQHKAGHAEIILTPLGPVLVYQISSSATRILIDIRGKMPSNASQFLKDKVGPHLTAAIKEPFEKALENGRIRSMPNSFLPASVCSKHGVLLLGDAFNMRHPLTGAGMSVALNDILIWRELLRSVPDLRDYACITLQQKKFLSTRRKSHSFVVNVLAQALYSLFSASDTNLFDLRQACFEYFKFGGRAVTDTIGLLSILHPSPIILIGHFFAVAVYAMFRTVVASKVWQLPYGIYRSINIFIKACKIIFPLIRSEMLTYF